MSIEKFVSPLVQEQFPEFYKSEGENFIAFVQAYYEWLEQQGNALAQARSLQDYRDIDTAPDDFIIHFKEKYLRNIEFETTTNKRLLVKHSLDIYRSKGTDRAVDLLFKLVFGTGAQVKKPGDDIFKLSDGTWVRPKYIEVNYSARTVDLVGKQITGVTSGASAFVEKYVKRKVKDAYVYILYISNIVGDFELGEILSAGTIYSDLPAVQGSLSSIQIVGAGQNFNVGDIVSIQGETGEYGLARVANTASEAGVVEFHFIDGGWGYSANAQINVSNTILGIANVQANTGDMFAQFEQVIQPVTDVVYTGLSGNFANGQNVFSTVGSGKGRILSVNTSASSLQVSRESGNFAVGGKIYITGNTVNATISTSTNNDITGTVTQLPTEVQLVLASNAGFLVQQRVFQVNTNIETANGIVTKIDGTILTVSNVVGTFLPSLPLSIRNSSNTGAITDVAMKLALHNISEAFIANSNPVVYGSVSGPTARVYSVSAGNNASFSIAGLDDTEVDAINTDYLSGNNVSNASYMTLQLNASTYGFPSNTSANVSGYLWTTLNFQNMTIGEITGIANVNPGSGYSASPKVVINEPYISCFNRKDYAFYLSNTTLNFAVGETVTQDNLIPGYDLIVASGAGWTNGEFVYTTTGNGNIIYLNGTTVRISNIQGTFSNSQVLHSIIDSTNTTITRAYSNAQVVEAHGTVLEGGALIIRVKREQFDNHWVENGNTIVGQTSGVTATLSHLAEWSNSTPIGLNAIVTANAVSANGTVTFTSITDSGYGYSNGQFISFSANNNSGTGTVNVAPIGIGSGYFKSTKGFLSADKFLFDGDFYQEYSYEVLSRLPFDRYSTILKKVLHPAGNKAFGAVLLESTAQSSSNVISNTHQGTFAGKLSANVAVTGQLLPYTNFKKALDFKNTRYWANGVGAFSKLTTTVDPGYSYTRSGSEGILCSDGLIRSFAANALPIHDNGFYSFNGFTNYCLQSEAFDAAVWVKNASTITPGATTSPDNNVTADTLTEDGTTAIHYVEQLNLSLPGGTTSYTASFFVKNASGTRNVRIVLQDASANGVNVYFDPRTGNVVQAAAAIGTGWTLLNFATLPVGNGFFRVALSFQCPASTTANFYIELTNGVSVSYAGDSTSGVYLWGAQVINGYFPTAQSPYLSTTTTTVTVGASAPLMTPIITTDQDFIAWGVFTCNGGGGGSVFQIDDGTISNRITIGHQSNQLPALIVTSGGPAVYSTVASSTPYGTRMALMVRRRAGAWTFAYKRATDVSPIIATETAGAFLVNVTRFVVGSGTLGSTNGPVEFIGVESGTFGNTAITNILSSAV